MTTAIAPLPCFRKSYSSLAAFYAANPHRDWNLAETFDGWESVCGAEGSFEWFVACAEGRA